MTEDRSSVVVVGVDGSTASVSALVTALRDARDRDRDVEVVTAWTWHDPFRVEDGFLLARAARRRALRAQSAVMARAARLVGTLPPVSAVIVEGDPAETLLLASRGADRLVLGVSDREETAESLFNAVRERCIRHAPCPVLVVPTSTSSPSPQDLYEEAGTDLVDVPTRGVSRVGP